jgi:transposase-like protein
VNNNIDYCCGLFDVTVWVMSKSICHAKWLHSEPTAYRWVEARVWPDGPVCPHCGGTASISKMNGKSTRIGAYKCYQCRKPFTVKIGTILEGSHLPLNLWLQAIYLVRQPKIGPVELVLTLGISPKTAKFILRRLAVADRRNVPANVLAGSVVMANGRARRSQRASFIAKAREYGANGSAKDFEKAFMKAVPPKRAVSIAARRRRRLAVGSGGEAARYP